MFKWAQPLPLVFAFACAASGRVAAEVPAPPKASAGGAQAAERYVSEIGADLASLDSHFQKYREAAEKLSALYAKLAAKAAEVGAAASGKGAAAGMGAAGGPGLGTAVGGDSQSQLLQATKQMQETQMSFNLQYLQLQSQMQNENRSYTAVSNIMKTKHDTVKNSISNVR